MKPLKSLIVEDSKDDAELLVRHLSSAGYDVQATVVQTSEEMKAALAALEWDIVLSDYAMPRFSGLDAVSLLKNSGLDIPIIIISGTIGEEIAVDAMVKGAHDYLLKNNLTRLAPAIEREIKEAANRKAGRLAEKALTVSEAAQRRLSETQSSILNALPAHICLLDGAGSVVTVNAGWKQFAAANCYDDDSFGVGANYLEVCESIIGETSAEGKEAADGIRAVLLRDSNQFEYEYACDSPEGKQWYRLMVSSLYGENSTGAVVMHVSITESRRAAEALRQAEARYRNIVESLPGIVYISQPSLPFAPIYVSPNIAGFGYTTEEWFDRPDMWVSLIHEQDRERVLQTTEAAIKQNLDTDLEYRAISRDGTVHWLHDKGRFVSDEQGKQVVWQGIILDVTKTKLLEEQLRQSQKLESVGRLAGGIAHDFNNMLTAINGYSELTLRRMAADDPLRRNIEEIKKAGERSALLTNQLLAFSRRQILQPVVLDINEVIADTIKMLERLIGEDVELVTALKLKAGRVNVDPGQLTQIIMNLAVNARDAMPQGGKLTIETADVFLEPDDIRQKIGVLPGAYVMLAVCDTGSGIDDRIQPHIFEPFFTTKEVGRGTGLGLATVYGIVKQSGGNIEVESEPGVGTAFKIYLPRVAEQFQAAEIKNTPSEPPAGIAAILLVEDEELVRNLTREILEDCGYTVIEARNGLEALEICESGNCEFDLLMTDVVMPQMGGRELAEKLVEKLPNIKILFTSGYTDDAMVRHGVIENSTNFIQKPFTFDGLARKVSELLNAENSKAEI